MNNIEAYDLNNLFNNLYVFVQKSSFSGCIICKKYSYKTLCSFIKKLSIKLTENGLEYDFIEEENFIRIKIKNGGFIRVDSFDCDQDVYVLGGIYLNFICMCNIEDFSEKSLYYLKTRLRGNSKDVLIFCQTFFNYNYRETKEGSNCLWCRFSLTDKRKIFCKEMKKDVLPNYTCDLWRYCA